MVRRMASDAHFSHGKPSRVILCNVVDILLTKVSGCSIAKTLLE